MTMREALVAAFVLFRENWPRERWTDAKLATWADGLSDLLPEQVLSAARAVIRGEKFSPTIAHLRDAVYGTERRVPVYAKDQWGRGILSVDGLPKVSGWKTVRVPYGEEPEESLVLPVPALPEPERPPLVDVFGGEDVPGPEVADDDPAIERIRRRHPWYRPNLTLRELKKRCHDWRNAEQRWDGQTPPGLNWPPPKPLRAPLPVQEFAL